ncbi:growth hormone secretagogue receptor type 1-like [Glandiceps talaboti]
MVRMSREQLLTPSTHEVIRYKAPPTCEYNNYKLDKLDMRKSPLGRTEVKAGAAHRLNCSIPFQDALRLSSLVLAIVTLFYVLIFIFGVLGNILVIFVVCRNRDMRSSTNYFLVNLSVADLLVLVICMPVALLETYIFHPWLLGEVMCKLVPFLEHTTETTSVLTLAAIAVERYVAFCHPLKASYVCTRKRTVKICLAIWIIAGSFCVPYTQFAEHKMVLTPEGDVEYTCGTYIITKAALAYVVLATVLFFVIPFFFLGVLYSVIANALRIRTQTTLRSTFTPATRSGSPRKTNARARTRYELVNRKKSDARKISSDDVDSRSIVRSIHATGPLYARRRAVFMLFAVVVVFFVCLLPQRVVSMLFVFDHAPRDSLSIHDILSLVTFCRIMLYVNSSVNPLLYSILSTKFRAAFLRALGVRQRKCKRSNTTMSTLQQPITSLSQKSPSPTVRKKSCAADTKTNTIPALHS